MKIAFSELDLKQLSTVQAFVCKNLNLDTQISQGITDGKWIEELIEICQEISLSVPHQEFPLIYAGILLARNHQVHHAIKVLRLCQKSVFGKALAEYLSETQAFSKRVKTFKEAKPYDAWMQTEIYQSIRAGVFGMIKHFATQNPPPFVDEPTIIDIGPGNGILTVEIVKQLRQVYPLRGIHLIFIEPSEEMMALAIQHSLSSLSTNTGSNHASVSLYTPKYDKQRAEDSPRISAHLVYQCLTFSTSYTKRNQDT